jgi:hypothetical protein
MHVPLLPVINASYDPLSIRGKQQPGEVRKKYEHLGTRSFHAGEIFEAASGIMRFETRCIFSPHRTRLPIVITAVHLLA